MVEAFQSRAGEAAPSRKARIPHKYALRILGRVLVEVLLILALIEGIFLGEKLAGILEDAILAKMRLAQILLMLVSTAPEIFDLALPSALLIAVYRVMLQLREDNELLIIAGTGIGAVSLMRVMTAVALPAMLLSLLMSGFVEPNSRFLERATLFESAYGALRSGTAAGEFHFPNGYTVFAQVADKNHPERRLFLHQALTPTTDRLVLAKRSRLIEQQDGWFTLRLQDFTVYDFPSAAGISAGEKKKTAMQMGTMRIGDYEQELSVDRLIYFAPRNSSEQTLVELASSNSSTEIARRLFRSLLCMFAPFIALVAVALTGRATLFAALPLAIVVLMSIDISATLLLKHIAPANLGLTLAALVATAVSILAILCSQVVARQRGLLKAVLGGR